MLRLNPNIDRAPAVKGQPDRSKLTIALVLPSGATETRIYSRSFESLDRTKPLKLLNQWRLRIFRKYMGHSPMRSRFHELEKQWLIDMYRSHKTDMESNGQMVNWSHTNWREL